MIYYLFHYSAHERNNEIIMMIAAVYKNDLFLLTTAVKLLLLNCMYHT